MSKTKQPGPIQIGGHVSSAGGIFTAIGRAQEIGAEAAQIFVSPPQTWRATQHTDEAIAKFREEHAASKLGEVWVHNIYLANLATETPEQLANSIGSVVNALTVGAAVGAKGVVLHTGSHRGGGMAPVLDQVTDALKRILDATPDITLALETMAGQGGAIGKEFEDLGVLLRAVDSPRLQVCLDTCHTFAAGYELRTPEGVEATMRAFDDAIGVEHLAVVHANDSKMPLGSLRDRHENIGDGHIGTDGFRAILGHPAFAGKAFMLEVPGIPTEAKPKGDGPDAENIKRLQAIRDQVAS
ncbi:MAG: deoxyribonuclease IV [Chloroflexi bacterium]|nr:MAG: deoxyribonuclease IV [Chloroflexota bacterium]